MIRPFSAGDFALSAGLVNHEKNIPAKQSETGAYPRLSCSHENQGRPGDHQRPPGQGPQAAVRLKCLSGVAAGREQAHSEAFDRSRRLTSAADYKQVFAQANRSGDGYLLVLARPNQLNRARLGLAIARSKISRACARNRVKRLIRESFRHHQPQLRGLDLVVLARRDLTSVDNQVLFQSLAGHWRRQQKLAKRLPDK